MKPCSAWCDDLIDRLKFITDWIDKGVPPVFWISGFYFPQAFLTGSLQNFARKHQFPIDQVNFNFNMVEADWTKLKKCPEDGVYIRGLFMEGARWHSGDQSIVDSLPKQLYTEIPVMHLDPERHRQEPKTGIYRCPVYKILSRRGTLSTTGEKDIYTYLFICVYV
jgi:dynein heavy chain